MHDNIDAEMNNILPGRNRKSVRNFNKNLIISMSYHYLQKVLESKLNFMVTFRCISDEYSTWKYYRLPLVLTY